MFVKNVFFAIALILAFCTCRSTKNQSAQPQEILLLLSENISPEDVFALGNIQIIEKKQTSRSQNQWLLKLDLTNEEFKALEDTLRKDPDVLDIIESKDEYKSSGNSKSGRSKPKTKN